MPSDTRKKCRGGGRGKKSRKRSSKHRYMVSPLRMPKRSQFRIPPAPPPSPIGSRANNANNENRETKKPNSDLNNLTKILHKSGIS